MDMVDMDMVDMDIPSFDDMILMTFCCLNNRMSTFHKFILCLLLSVNVKEANKDVTQHQGI